MCEEGVTFHFSDTHSATSGTSFDRLTIFDSDLSCGSSGNLVQSDVFEPLVESGSNEDSVVEKFTSESAEHGLVSGALVATAEEPFGEVTFLIGTRNASKRVS